MGNSYNIPILITFDILLYQGGRKIMVIRPTCVVICPITFMGLLWLWKNIMGW